MSHVFLTSPIWGHVSGVIFYLCLALIVLDLVLFSLIANLISSHACHLFPYISHSLINKVLKGTQSLLNLS